MKLRYFLITAVLAMVVLCFGAGAGAQTADVQAMIAQLQAQIASLLQQIQALQARQGSNASMPSGGWCHTFNTNLGYANSGSAEVGYLHTVLGKEGISYGSDTGNTYGEGTKEAVAQFQEKYASDVLPLNFPKSAEGYVGTSTRAKLNALYGCATSVTTPVSVVKNPSTPKKLPDISFLSSTQIDNLAQKYSQRIGEIKNQSKNKNLNNPSASPQNLNVDAGLSNVLKEYNVPDAVQTELDDINSKAVTWTANYNTVFTKSEQDKKNLTGGLLDDKMKDLINGKYKFPDFSLKNETVSMSSSVDYPVYADTFGDGTVDNFGDSRMPDAFDWRDVGGKNYITSVKNQGSCGSCWAFAAIASLEGTINAYYNNPSSNGLTPNLSEEDLVSCAWPSNRLYGGCSGLYSWDTETLFSNYFVNTGISSESCFPYPASGSISCNVKCSSWRSQVWKTDNSYINVNLNTNNIENIKTALVTRGPVEAEMVVYSDLYAYTGGVYKHTTDEISDQVSAHMVTIVGYGIDTRYNLPYWIVKNSWGPNWGEKGYFKIAMGDSGIDQAYVLASGVPYYTTTVARVCTDADKDGYCYWGTGTKPSSGCPSSCSSHTTEDCDDSSSSVHSGCGMVYDNGFLNISATPDYAYVSVDGEYVGNTPTSLALKVGTHNIIIDREGYIDYKKTVNITKNNVTTLQADLQQVVTITSPNGGENWAIDETHNVIWDSLDKNAKFNVLLFSDIFDPDTFKTIASDVSGYSYSWKIPSTFTPGNYGVEVTVLKPSGDYQYSYGNDYSDNVFTISPKSTIPLTATCITNPTSAIPGSTVTSTVTASGGTGSYTYHWTGSCYYTAGSNESNTCAKAFSNPGNYQSQVTVTSGVESKTIDCTPFTITQTTQSSITVTSPNGGENWATGQNYTVTWQETGVSNVKVSLQNVLTSAITVIANSVSASTGSYQWMIPYSIPHGSYRILISDANNASVSDQSDNVFTLVSPANTLTATCTTNPASAIPGSTVTSTVTASGGTGSYNYHWTGACHYGTGANELYTCSMSFANPGSYQSQVTVTSGVESKTIDCTPFTITQTNQSSITVTSPNGGETWQVGQTKRITWSSTGLSSTDKVSISISAGSSGGMVCDASGICMSSMSAWGTNIVSNIPATQGYYDWTINTGNLPPSKPDGQNYRISVEVMGKAINDASDNYFSITSSSSTQPSITITSSTLGDTWKVGETHNITWTSNGISNVKVSLQNVSTGAKTVIANSIVASIGSFRWTVPVSQSMGSYKILIADANNASVSDQSDNVLSISEPGASGVTITSISLDHASQDGPSFPIDVYGTGFTSGSRIKFDNLDITTSSTLLSTTHLQTTITSLKYVSVGAHPIVVINPDGKISNPVSFNVTASTTTPVITSISPNSAPQNLTKTIDIYGNNFSAGSVVMIDNSREKTINTTFVSSAHIKTTITTSSNYGYYLKPGTHYINIEGAGGTGYSNYVTFDVIVQTSYNVLDSIENQISSLVNAVAQLLAY